VRAQGHPLSPGLNPNQLPALPSHSHRLESRIPSSPKSLTLTLIPALVNPYGIRGSVARKCRVGIVGYGKIGQFLVQSILGDSKCQELMELAFVCDPGNPDAVKDGTVPPEAILEDLEAFEKHCRLPSVGGDGQLDLVVEVQIAFFVIPTLSYSGGSP
jgi:hypothetical protein